MDEGTRKAVEKIEKLMRLSASNPNQEEAASALAKAQELLAAYNLDMTVVEQNSGASGKRLDDRISGGMHRYQRELWRNIAELNWCMYWTMKVRAKEGSYAARRKRRWTHEHRLVGRQINVIATQNMARYLEQTIARLCSARLGEEGRSGQYYSSWAVAFREGIADRVIDKIQDRRQKVLDDEEKKLRATREAARKGVSTATALTVSGLSESEEAANYDFLHGEGAWARKQAAAAEWDKEWAERRAARAEAEAEAERAYAAWAEAHPEEAAKERRKEESRERAKERARQRRIERGSGYGRIRFRQTAEEMRRESGAYYAGIEAGEKVSIDPQMDNGDKRRIGRAKV